jgi:disulfide bond formation protein DsbB
MNKILAYFQDPKHLAAAVVAASAGALAFAYTSQYGFGLDPCQLCFYQRKPYFLNITLGLVAFALAPKNKKAAVLVLILCGLTFVADAAIAGFHVGVEQHWWKGLESCSNYALPDNASVEELRKFIMSRDVIDCSVPAFVLFGISMAGYNFMLATALALSTFFMLWRSRCRAQ